MKIQYVDNDDTTGCYNYIRDSIIIDVKLKDYPHLKRYVLEHEIKHRQIGRNLLGHFAHDLKDGWFLAFGEGKIIEELRSYRKFNRKNLRDYGIWYIFGVCFVNGILNFFYSFLFPISEFYRWICMKRKFKQA